MRPSTSCIPKRTVKKRLFLLLTFFLFSFFPLWTPEPRVIVKAKKETWSLVSLFCVHSLLRFSQVGPAKSLDGHDVWVWVEFIQLRPALVRGTRTQTQGAQLSCLPFPFLSFPSSSFLPSETRSAGELQQIKPNGSAKKLRLLSFDPRRLFKSKKCGRKKKERNEFEELR